MIPFNMSHCITMLQGLSDFQQSLDWTKDDVDFLHSHIQDEDAVIEYEQVEELQRVASRMSSKHQPSHTSNLNAAALPILPWLTPGAIHLPSGVEEVIDGVVSER